MDQLRNILGWLKRQHFWVLSVLVGLIGIFCWWSAAGKLSAEFTANKTAIESEFGNLSTLRGKAFHPNETIKERQIAETKKLADDVKATWERLHEKQRENVLEWPAALSKEFRDYVAERSFGEDIPPHLRDNYQNYVERHFPKLAEKVNARPLAEGETGGYGGEGGERMPSRRAYASGEGGGAYGQMAEDEGDYVCEWIDQDVVRKELDFPTRPSPLRIWVTQENLWVLHTLLQVIANTNEAAGATRMSNAAVPVIYSLQVGRNAGLTSRGKERIYKLPSMTAIDPSMMGEGAPSLDGGVTTEGEGGMPGEFADEGRSMEGEMNGPISPEQEKAFLLSRRYLDGDGKPISAGAAGGGDPSMAADPAMAADPTAAATPVSATDFGVEYKRLPVRMTLQMDQRWLTHLIAECANQPLQVEVQEVRINPPGGGAGGESGGIYGGGRGGYSEGGNSAANLFPQRTGVQQFPAQPQVVDVVIQGIIYIFNPPNPGILDTPQEEPPLAATM